MKLDKQRWPALAAVAVAAACTLATAKCSAEQGDWTIHTVSVHVGVSGLNNLNPGVAYDLTDNFRVGGLYNSYRKPSVYALGILPLHPRFRLAAGVISGYTHTGGVTFTGKTTGVIPAVAAEFDVTDRLSVGWFGQALNLEVKF